MSDENTNTIVDNEKGLTYSLKIGGKDSIYHNLGIWIKEYNTIEAAVKDVGATAVLNGFNSASVAAQQQRARNSLCDDLTQGEGEKDTDFNRRAIAAARDAGKTLINSKEDAEAYVYGSSKLSMGTIAKRTEKLSAEIRELAKNPSANPLEIESKRSELKRYKAQLSAFLLAE